jgi:hypothetical protein
VYATAFSNKIMPTVIIVSGSILIIFGYSEAYGQTMASTDIAVVGIADGSDGRSSNNTTHSDIIGCLVDSCITPNFQLPSNTSIIAIAFVNLTLEDLQDYKEVLKSEVSQNINNTIDSLGSGTGGSTFSICAPFEYRFELPCPLIRGITLSPQNLTLLEEQRRLLEETSNAPPGSFDIVARNIMTGNYTALLANTTGSPIVIKLAIVRELVNQNQLEARFIAGGPIPTNGTEGAFGYGILTDDPFDEASTLSGNVSLLTHTHAGVIDSEEQSSADDPIWHNHFVRLGNMEQCGEDLGIIDITWQSPGEVRINDNNATISQIPTSGFEGRDSITNEPLSMTLDQAGSAFSFRLNPMLGEDGLLEAVCVTDITSAERGAYIGPRYSIQGD